MFVDIPSLVRYKVLTVDRGREHMSKIKFRGIFVKKLSHLFRFFKGTLRNLKNVVGKFLFCTDGHKGGFKMCLSSSREKKQGLKVPENHL